ncbi:Putative leucine-rich repeats containing F-box pr otein FBL3 [Trichuris trichiura]|uniref:Putative leucine-rich repeats containing F-box pr otein FBL3 n=1 Tax=Trichuris trichiura TaxID=36087 RepID=A0A077Z1G9_TRITR|nr:Putative leucine-rich repeats containing F-box pr otein FBL3 [Trichuris trichiura]
MGNVPVTRIVNNGNENASEHDEPGISDLHLNDRSLVQRDDISSRIENFASRNGKNAPDYANGPIEMQQAFHCPQCNACFAKLPGLQVRHKRKHPNDYLASQSDQSKLISNLKRLLKWRQLQQVGVANGFPKTYFQPHGKVRTVGTITARKKEVVYKELT